MDNTERIPKTGIFSRPEPVRGIIAVRNLKTGNIFLKKTEDAVKSFRDERFRLDLSMHESEELQREYSSLGLELFTIELDAEADENDDLDLLLEERKKHYKAEGVTLYSSGPSR